MSKLDEIKAMFEGETFHNKTDSDLRGDKLVTVEQVRHPREDESEAFQFRVCSTSDRPLKEQFDQFEVQERIQNGDWVPKEEV